MDTQLINIQFSVFGDFKDLNPSNPDMVIDFMNMLKGDDFVPSTFGEIPINTNQIKLYNRFSFSNKDGVTINIGFDRIDIIFGYNEDGKYSSMEYNQLKTIGIEYISKIVNKYKKNINRLAFNATKIYNDELSQKLEDKFNNNIIAAYSDSNPIEWSQRIVNRESGTFRTDINICLNLSKTIGKLTKKNVSMEFDGVVALFDINTVININQLYSEKDLNDFFDTANNAFKKVEASIEE